MAVNLFTGATDNQWGVATNWSQGTVPTNADGHVTTFDATSPSCTIATSSRNCVILDCTGYTNTLTFTNQLTVGGSITFSATMTIAGSAQLIINATGTLTSNGKEWPNNMTFSSTGATYTVSGTWTVQGTLTWGTCTVDGGTINCTGSLTPSGSPNGGTTNVVMNGTGTFGGSTFRNNLTINTAGTITLGTILFAFATFTYTAGTVITAGSNFTVNGGGGTTTINAAGMDGITTNAFTNFFINTNCTVSLSSDLYVTTLFRWGSGGSSVTVNGNNIYCSGSISSNGTSINGSILSGTTTINLTGTGSWSPTSAPTCTVRNNLVINTSGTITLSGDVTYSTGTLTVTAFNSIIHTGSTLNFGGTLTCNTSGFSLNILTVTTTPTFNGTNGFTVSTFNCTTSGLTITFKESNSYTITTAMTITGTAASPIVITSAHGSTQTIIKLNYGATQDIEYCNVTRVDSSSGQTIKSYKGTLTTATNWALMVAPVTIGYTFN